jgi:hypothetical protein
MWAEPQENGQKAILSRWKIRVIETGRVTQFQSRCLIRFSTLCGLDPLWDSCEQAVFCRASDQCLPYGLRVVKFQVLRLIPRPAGRDVGQVS